MSHRAGQLQAPLQMLNGKTMLLRAESRLVSLLGLSVKRANNISNPSAQPKLQGDSGCFQLGEEIGGDEVRHFFHAILFTEMLDLFSLGFSPCSMYLCWIGTVLSLCPLQLLPWICLTDSQKKKKIQ